MATQEELNNQRDLNENKRETVELTQQELGILESLRRATQSRVDDESDILNYIRATNNILNDQFKVSKNISVEKDLAKKVSREILNINENLNTILQNELGLEKTSNSLAKTRQKLIKDQLTLQTLLNTQFTEDAELNFEINKQLKEQIGNIDKLLGKVKDVEEESKKIKDNFGVKSFAGLEKIAKEVPILRKFIEPLSKATEASRLQAVSNKFTADQRKALEEQIKGDRQRIDTLQKIAQAEGKGIKKGALKEFGFGDLSGTAASAKARSLQKGVNADLGKNMQALNALPKAIKPFIAGLKQLATALKNAMKSFIIVEFIIALTQGDKATGNLAKSMNLAYEGASNLRQELTATANASGDIFVTTKGLQETLVAINSTLGTNVMLNKENLVAFTKLREVAGLTNEELMGIQSIVNATGGDFKEATGEILAQSRISSARLGVALNEKEVLKSIKDVSAATTLSLSKNPGLIADAAATAKSLGMELSKVDQIAGSLLEFESSISSELEAELLLGRDINLEKARQAALNNDLATLAKEISEQAGSAADFGKMNRLQQEAIAKSVGMNRDELAKTLFVQEQLLNVSGDEAKLRESRINSLIAEKGLAETQNILAKEGIEGLEKQASVQEQFSATMEKLKEIFVQLAQPLLPIFNALASVFQIIGNIMKILDPAIQTTMVGIVALGDVINMILSPLETIEKIMKGDFAGIFSSTINQVGNAEVSAKENYGFSFNTTGRAGDIISPAIGKTQVSTKEGGLFELSQNDDLLAGPGLASRTTSGGDNSSLIVEIRALRAALESRPINVNTTVSLDGEKIGSNKNVIRGLGNRATELGTEVATNSYQIQ